MTIRTRAQCEADMLSLVADARSAAAEGDMVSYDLDHDLLSDLLLEWQAIPQQRHHQP